MDNKRKASKLKITESKFTKTAFQFNTAALEKLLAEKDKKKKKIKLKKAKAVEAIPDKKLKRVKTEKNEEKQQEIETAPVKKDKAEKKKTPVKNSVDDYVAKHNKKTKKVEAAAKLEKEKKIAAVKTEVIEEKKPAAIKKEKEVAVKKTEVVKEEKKVVDTKPVTKTKRVAILGCKEEGCDRVHYALGRCKKHYVYYYNKERKNKKETPVLPTQVVKQVKQTKSTIPVIVTQAIPLLKRLSEEDKKEIITEMLTTKNFESINSMSGVKELLCPIDFIKRMLSLVFKNEGKLCTEEEEEFQNNLKNLTIIFSVYLTGIANDTIVKDLQRFFEGEDVINVNDKSSKAIK